MNRRRFLQTVLLASGAVYAGLPLGCEQEQRHLQFKKTTSRPPLSTASQRFSTAHRVLQSGDLSTITPTQVRTCDVVIVGGGPAGLTACHLLHKAGYDVLLLENEERVGGAAVNGEWDGVKFPLGSVYIVEYEGIIKEMMEEAGKKVSVTPDDSLLLHNNTYTDFWNDTVISSLPIAGSDKIAMRKFRDDVLAMEHVPEYPLPSVLPPSLARLDAMSVKEYMAQYNSPFLQELMNLYTLSSMAGRSDEVNAYCFLNFYSGEFGNSFNLPRYTFPEGLNGFTTALSSLIPPSSLLTENVAFHLENTNNGVMVRSMSASGSVTEIRAKAAIASVQKFMLPHIIPDLPTPQRNAISTLRYSPYTTIHLCSKQQLLPENVFDTWVTGQEAFFSDILNPTSVLPPGGQHSYIYSLFSLRPPQERSMLMNEESFVRFAREAAGKATALMGSKAQESICEIQCWAWGHSMVQARIGSHNGPAQQASKTFGNILFANTDNYSSPAIENAVASGVRAADDIKTILSRAIKGALLH